MKKSQIRKALIFFLLIISNFIHSQSRLGFSYRQIREEFIKKKMKIESKTTTDGVPYLTVDGENHSTAYYFNENYICKRTRLFPYGQGLLNALVQKYNDNYVAISDSEWKMYTNKGIAYIKLIHTDDDVVYFEWN